jgi:hypothetical protein
MKTRLLYNGREITGDFPCDFCHKGTVEVKAALKSFGSLSPLEKKERIHKGFNDFVARARQEKLDVYQFYAESVRQEAEFSSVESISSSVNVELSAFCNKCGKQHFFRLSAEPVKLADALTSDEIYNLPLPDDEVLERVAARTGFASFTEFKDWLNIGVSVQKASAILNKTTQELGKLSDPDIQQVTETLREIPSFLERKTRERRMEVWGWIKEQERIDRSLAEGR